MTSAEADNSRGSETLSEDAGPASPEASFLPHVGTPQTQSASKKGLLAVALLLGSMVGLSAFGIHRFASSGKKISSQESTRVGDRPAAASAEPRKLELVNAAASTPAVARPRIPALVPDDDEVAEPIGVRRTGSANPAGSSSSSKPMAPEDAPVLLVSSRPGAASTSIQIQRRGETASAGSSHSPRDSNDDTSDPLAATSRNLEAYQRQLQALLENLNRATDTSPDQGAPHGPAGALLTAQPTAVPGASMTPATPGLFGGQLQASATPRVMADMLGNRSLTLPKGSMFTCALKTRLVSAASGMVSCIVQRNVYGADGRVVLLERGSDITGEYRITSVRPGQVRIPVLWTRALTPLGVSVDLESPATGPLGESGVDGYIDNRWTERIGAAMLLSLIDDSVKLVIQSQTNDRQADTIVLPSTTSNTSKLAEKVLDSTINIPPLVYQNQGGIVGISVARDVDFSTVYELRPTAR